MGTHPIFESDFDCLTESRNKTVKTGNKVGREKMGEGTQPYVPTGRPRGRTAADAGKVVKKATPAVIADAKSAAPAKAKGRGRPAKVAAVAKEEEPAEEADEDEDAETAETEE